MLRFPSRQGSSGREETEALRWLATHAVPLPVKEAIYRIAQEALHNTVRHTRAARVVISLARDPNSTSVEIRDDGLGFEAGADFLGHLGLRSMRERASRLGGTLEVSSAPGSGTTVRARIPSAPAA